MDRINILIVDDHPLFREGLKSIISGHPGYEIIGEAGEGREALRLAEELKPDLVIMDISLPDISGIKLTRQIREMIPKAEVLALSIHNKIGYVMEILKAGAKGYLVKESAAAKLFQGLDSVSKGRHYIDDSLTPQMINIIKHNPNDPLDSFQTELASLTHREREVMVLLAQGLSVKEIGEKLFISPKTVENHRSNIKSKLNLSSTVDLIRYAFKHGLVDPDQWEK